MDVGCDVLCCERMDAEVPIGAMRKQASKQGLNDLTRPFLPAFDSTSFLSDFDNHVYFATQQADKGLIYKVATGNAGGASTTAPSVINTVTTTQVFEDYMGLYDGAVRPA